MGLKNLEENRTPQISGLADPQRIELVSFRIDERGVPPYDCPMNDEDDELPTPPSERSATAREVSKLQDTVRRLMDERDVLPQPLFWSLFNSRLSDIKKQKEVSRLLREKLDGVG